MPSVAIGPEFFRKAFNDYADPYWAIIREFLQNSIDCGSSTVRLTCTEMGGITTLSVENDGTPMSRETLVEKLLCLGGSGKDFAGTSVGGYGKAKEVLYFCHRSYEIHSGDLVVNGSGAVYEIAQAAYVHGTRSVIVLNGLVKSKLEKAFKQWVEYGQWSGDLCWNDEHFKADLRKGSPRRDLGFGMVYTNRTHRYRLVVRIHGMPMFVEYTGLDRCVVVELAGKSSDVMTSNRDGLVNPYARELTSFVTELSVDKRSALKRNRGPRYTRYRGTKLVNTSRLNVADLVAPIEQPIGTTTTPEWNTPFPVTVPPGFESGGPCPTDHTLPDGTVIPGAGFQKDPIAGVSVGESEEVQAPVYHEDVDAGPGIHAPAYTASFSAPVPRRQVATLGTEFILKNETDLKVPAHFDPGSGEFSSHSMKLTRIWGRIMMELHRLFDVEAEFSIGFIMSEDCEAEHEDGTYGKVYYLNPAEVVEQKSSMSKSFRKRWALTDRDELIMTGLHEFVHGLGKSQHDEQYAGKLTDMAAKVMKNRKRFNWCFQ